MKPCLVCGTPTNGPRCPAHQRAKDRGRNQARSHYHGDWERTSRTTRQAWVAEHGWVCAGLGADHPPHPALDLELDHTTGRVLCHQANVTAGPAGPDSAIPH